MNTLAPRLAVTAFAVVLAGLAAAATVPAGAATGSYTQSQLAQIGDSFDTQFGEKVRILDSTLSGPRAATPYPAVAGQFTGLAGTVTRIVLSISDFDHQAPRDVDLMLVGPEGQRALVMSDVGGDAPVTDVDLIFDDASTSYLNFDDTVTSGTYHPSNDSAGDDFPSPAPSATGAPSSLATFNGTNPNGFWALYVVDDLAMYAGEFEWWALSVSTTGGDYPSTLTVEGAQGTVTDVDVQLQIDHNRFDDIDMLLVGPQGQQATLLSDAGGPNEVDGANFVLDDSAPAGVPNPVMPGTYRPTDVVVPSNGDSYRAPAPASDGNTNLSVFNGTNPNGAWRLFIIDDTRGYRGYIATWSLRITTTDEPVPAPAPTPNPIPTPTAGPATDIAHPRVTSTRPHHRAAGVRRGADVIATFSEAVRPGTLTSASVYLSRKGSTRHVPATISWRPGSLRVLINPRQRLWANTTYRAVITPAVTDVAGNRLDQKPNAAGLQQKTWAFTTR